MTFKPTTPYNFLQARKAASYQSYLPPYKEHDLARLIYYASAVLYVSLDNTCGYIMVHTEQGKEIHSVFNTERQGQAADDNPHTTGRN